MNRKIVFAWGRFNPPTTGHKVVMDRVAKEAKSRNAEYAIFASKSNDPKKNPLTFSMKVKFLKQSFPKHSKNINASPGIKTVVDVMKFLDKKYQEVSLVVGSDRAQEFKRLLNKYNGKEYDFDNIEIISAGERDPDAEDVTGMSASKMRKYAVDGNYKEFEKGSPMKNPKPLYDAIRRGMQITEHIYESIADTHVVGDKSVTGRRFNALLRFGLVPMQDLPITKRTFKDLDKSGSNPELRKHIIAVVDKTLEYIMADDLLYRRMLLLLHDGFLMSEDHRDALVNKSDKSGISYQSLLEVFLRGLASSPIYGDKTAHQYAFERVNSFVSGGNSRRTVDADIWESYNYKSDRRTGMKKFKELVQDTTPAEWGTKELASRYSKEVPGQPDDVDDIGPLIDFHEVAPPSEGAKRFIKANKAKFKKQYGENSEKVLYATAWKLFGDKS
tara:strand:+ start:9067 stop:10395 length:1329 start_codon:yes stop_codon:yes gene_type:complete